MQKLTAPPSLLKYSGPIKQFVATPNTLVNMKHIQNQKGPPYERGLMKNIQRAQGLHQNMTESPYLYSVKIDLFTPSLVCLYRRISVWHHQFRQRHFINCIWKLPLIPLPPSILKYGLRKLFWICRDQGKCFPWSRHLSNSLMHFC